MTCLALLWGGNPAVLQAEEEVAETASPIRAEPLLIDPETIPTIRPEQGGFLSYLRERTHFGIGLDEAYNPNVFLARDNSRWEDYQTTLEGDVFFADPKGALLYGFEHEINAFRYHRLDANAINHDFSSFIDLDPGGRVQWGATYNMNVHNGLHQDPIKSDLVRTSTDFQRSVEHSWTAKMKYALNETNSLVPKLAYSLIDDQTVNDAESDRRTFGALMDFDHNVSPTWVLFGGYQFEKPEILGNKTKNSRVHALRLGARHDLSQISDLEATFRYGRRKFKAGRQATELGWDVKWKYSFSPRTSLTLTYLDQQIPSFQAGLQRFRSVNPSAKLTYALSPLTELTLEAAHSKQKSSAADVAAGSSSTASKSELYQLNSGLLWRFREKAKVTLDYKLTRSKTGDFTNQIVTLGFEAEI